MLLKFWVCNHNFPFKSVRDDDILTRFYILLIESSGFDSILELETETIKFASKIFEYFVSRCVLFKSLTKREVVMN